MLILVVVVLILLCRGNTKEAIESHTVDTLTIVRVDTVTKYRTKYITERIVDTVYIKVDNYENVALPRVQRHFSEKTVYDAWISGFDPIVDSIRIYPKTEYVTITNTNIREVSTHSWKIYLGGGFQTISRDFAPCVSIRVATPQKWLISANIGIFKNKPLYGVEVAYKIFEK